MNSITIRLPWPSRIQSPNVHAHWAAKASAAKKAKATGALLARQAIGPGRGGWWVVHAGAVQVRVEFTPPVHRHRDIDNCIASIKHELDGIASSIGIDDSRWVWAAPEITAPARPGHVTVTIEPVEAA